MDRITIINDALRGTGNNAVNIEYDGSDEWQSAESAWRRALNFLLPRHTWNFGNTSAALAGLLSSSPHPVYDKAFQLPGDCLLVEAAWYNGRGLSEYEILDQKFCCRYDQDVTIKYVRAPLVDQWPPLFVELVTMKLEALFLAGFNEDTDNARAKDRAVEAMLNEVRTALDKQEPARAVFRSRTALRRAGGYSLSRVRLCQPPNDSVP